MLIAASIPHWVLTYLTIVWITGHQSSQPPTKTWPGLSGQVQSFLFLSTAAAFLSKFLFKFAADAFQTGLNLGKVSIKRASMSTQRRHFIMSVWASHWSSRPSRDRPPVLLLVGGIKPLLHESRPILSAS